jgi:hypothetical protein
MRSRLACIALALGAAGCAAIWGIEEKTLTGDAGPDASITVDAATDVADTGAETGGDAGPSSEPSAPCAQQGTFLYCNDFDTTGSIGATWDWNLIDGDGGTLAFDTTNFKTSPRAARSTSPPRTGSVQLGKDLGVLSSDMRVAFDLYLDMDDTALSGMAEIGVLQLRGQDDLVLNYVLGSGKRARIQAWHGTSGNYFALPEPKSRTWMRAVVSYDGAQGVRVLHDGVEVQSVPAHAFGAPGQALFIVGHAYVNGGGTASSALQIDNVVARGR